MRSIALVTMQRQCSSTRKLLAWTPAICRMCREAYPKGSVVQQWMCIHGLGMPLCALLGVSNSGVLAPP